jgi:NSS family neurotransmitter:Na+ symporter
MTGGGGRGAWGSRIGFVLAAAGSAIGLGNIWGFSYKAAQSGGGAFVLVYCFFVALIGIPVLFSELAIGRAAQKSPVGAFARLAPGTRWPLVGALGVATGFAILAFYSVIAGWTVGYLYKAVSLQFRSGMTVEHSQEIFEGLSGSPVLAVTWTAIFFVLTILVVRGGIHAGIERASKILMPVFFLLLVGLAVRSVTLEGAGGGVYFLFNAEFGKLTPRVVLDALAQALFSMSLGMGAMITYGSYLSRKQNMPKAGVTVAIFDTGIALVSGLMIFPALFAKVQDPHALLNATGGDEALVFLVLPTIFDSLPMGHLFAIAFYLLLAIAALTSSISLLEVIASYFVDERGWSREKATWLPGIACFLLAVPCAANDAFMGIVVRIFYNYALAFGALLICVFVGWRWGVPAARKELTAEGAAFPLLGFWGVLIKYVCPLVVGVILVQRILDLF